MTVQTEDYADEDPAALQAQREQYADEAEAAVKTIRKKLAGVKKSLAAAEADAKRLRAEAKENKP